MEFDQPASEVSLRNIYACRLQSLSAFGRQALVSTDFRSLAENAARIASVEFGVEHCNVWELLADNMLQLRGSSNARSVDIVPPYPLMDKTPAAYVLQTHSPLVLGKDSSPEDFIKPAWQVSEPLHTLNVPLLASLQPLGVLEASSVNLPFSPADVDFFQILAHLLSGALQRVSLVQQKHDDKMRRAEQMMAIGQVAAGVAHELRNPLTSIKGLVQVNLREAKQQSLPADDFAIIEHEIRRMERTLQTFLDFAKPPQPNRKPQLLNAIVDRVLSLVQGRARKQRVVLEPDLQPDLIVNADQDQLQQLLLNLVLNALDAMPSGGTIVVKTSEDPDHQVELMVRDTGPGIAAHILPKVFETFVSSKETGVGLGLPVSQRIADDHGGTLSAYNMPNGGACFVLRLASAS